MSPIHALALGVVEGVTEFLPVSSTAHLILAARLMGLQQTDFVKFFTVFIQSGAILAVAVLYLGYLKANPRILTKVFASFVPTAVVGFLLSKVIKGFFFGSAPLIAFSLSAVGAAFIAVEFLLARGKLKALRRVDGISVKDAVIIGLAQSLAVVPGVSRSGAVIIAMIILGYRRKDSAVYSFLLAVPTILAAGAFDVYGSFGTFEYDRANLAAIAIGFLTSFAAAYLSLKWLIGYLKENPLTVFGYYRIVLSLVLAVLILTGIY